VCKASTWVVRVCHCACRHPSPYDTHGVYTAHRTGSAAHKSRIWVVMVPVWGVHTEIRKACVDDNTESGMPPVRYAVYPWIAAVIQG
jgi:hypothetical protein